MLLLLFLLRGGEQLVSLAGLDFTVAQDERDDRVELLELGRLPLFGQTQVSFAVLILSNLGAKVLSSVFKVLSGFKAGLVVGWHVIEKIFPQAPLFGLAVGVGPVLVVGP